MKPAGLDLDQLKQLLAMEFAPWILAMNIMPLEATPSGMIFELPKNTELVRGSNILCGQAIAACADTISVLTLYAHNKELRALTTIDMNTQFLRPLFLGPVEAVTNIQSNGRRMANIQVEFRQRSEDGLGKLAATANCSFAYL